MQQWKDYNVGNQTVPLCNDFLWDSAGCVRIELPYQASSIYKAHRNKDAWGISAYVIVIILNLCIYFTYGIFINYFCDSLGRCFHFPINAAWKWTACTGKDGLKTIHAASVDTVWRKGIHCISVFLYLKAIKTSVIQAQRNTFWCTGRVAPVSSIQVF